MSTWEELDDSLFDVDSKEEANLCLLADVSTSNAESALDTSSNDEEPQPNDTVNFDDEDVIFKSREDLIKWYNQLLSASTCVSYLCFETNYPISHSSYVFNYFFFILIYDNLFKRMPPLYNVYSIFFILVYDKKNLKDCPHYTMYILFF